MSRHPSRGTDLVDYATREVSVQFSTYSVLFSWESAEAAFRHRRGFCTQYNGALAIILSQLGPHSWLVYARRLVFDDQSDWILGHTWVRVRVDGEIRDVCARSGRNGPGSVNFVALGQVRTLGRTARGATTLDYGTAVLAIARARLRGRRRPQWVEHPRAPWS